MLDIWTLIKQPNVLDYTASGVCVFGALLSVYLMQLIVHERPLMVDLQRIAFALLAAALIANAIVNVGVIDGHRPSGVLVDIAIVLLLLVMAIRGRKLIKLRQHGR